MDKKNILDDDKFVDLWNSLVDLRVSLQNYLNELESMNGSVPSESIQEWNRKITWIEEILWNINRMDSTLEESWEYLVQTKLVPFEKVRFFANGII